MAKRVVSLGRHSLLVMILSRWATSPPPPCPISPAYLIVAPVAWASAHAEGRAGLPCPQVGGPAAAGPRTFYLCGHGVGAAFSRVGGRRRRPRYGHPSVARARVGAARPAIAGSAGSARSKGPRPKGGVDPKGPGLSAVPTTPAQAGVTPPLMPFVISGPIFLHFVSKPILAGALLAFRWPTRRFFGGPSVGHVAHIPPEPLSLLGGGGPLGEALVSRVAHTSRRRFWRRQGGPRAASPHSIMGALVAPPGRQVRHGPAIYTA